MVEDRAEVKFCRSRDLGPGEGVSLHDAVGFDDWLGEGEVCIVVEPCLVNVDAVNVNFAVAWVSSAIVAEGVD